MFQSLILSCASVAMMLFASFSTPAFAQVEPTPTPIPSLPPSAEQNIIQNLQTAGTYTTLLAAIDTAGLTETLSGNGPYTLFAPTDEAFSAIPADTLNALLANQEQLQALLLYHVLGGEYTSTDMRSQDSLKTLQGQTIAITVTESSIMVNDAMIIEGDIDSSNGVIHSINAVLLPTEEMAAPAQVTNVQVKNVYPKKVDITFDEVINADFYQVRVQTAKGKFVKRKISLDTTVTLRGLKPGRNYVLYVRANNEGVFGTYSEGVQIQTPYGKNTLIRRLQLNDRFTILLKAIDTAGMNDLLTTTGQYTLFAPTNAAFGKLSDEQLDALFDDPNRLKEILRNHLVKGRLPIGTMLRTRSVETVDGEVMTVDNSQLVTISGALIIRPNMRANNGIAHGIDTVIMD